MSGTDIKYSEEFSPHRTVKHQRVAMENAAGKKKIKNVKSVGVCVCVCRKGSSHMYMLGLQVNIYVCVYL